MTYIWLWVSKALVEMLFPIAVILIILGLVVCYGIGMSVYDRLFGEDDG